MDRPVRRLSQTARNTRCIVRVVRDAAFEERLEETDRAQVVFNTGADEVDILRVDRVLGCITIQCSNGDVMSLDINGLIEGRTIKLRVPNEDTDPTRIERASRKTARFRLRLELEDDASRTIVRFLVFAAAKNNTKRRRRARLTSSVDSKLLAFAESVALVPDNGVYGPVSNFEANKLVNVLLRRASELIERATRLVKHVELSCESLLSDRQLDLIASIDKDSSLSQLRQYQKEQKLPVCEEMHSAVLDVASMFGRLYRPFLSGFFDIHSNFEYDSAELPPTDISADSSIFGLCKDTCSTAVLLPLLAIISEAASPDAPTAAYKARVLEGTPPLIFNIGSIYSAAFGGGPFRQLTDELLMRKISDADVDKLRNIR